MFRFRVSKIPLKLQIICLLLLGLLIALFSYPDTPISFPLQDLSVAEAQELVDSPNSPFVLDPRCKPVLNYEPSRTKVALLFHGYTNCPAQYDELTPLLTDAGYNVYAPLLPYHGNRDKLTDATSYLTPNLLEEHLGESISVARTLGDDITAIGVSGGGVLATAALASPEVDYALSLAPFHLPAMLPSRSIAPTTKIASSIPNYTRFWDPGSNPDSREGPAYAYRRFSTHSLAAYQDLTLRLPHNNRESRGRLTVVLNRNDEAINNTFAERYPRQLEDMNLETEVIYIPNEWNLEHDIIDPNQSFARPDLVYPFILTQLDETP